MYLNQRMPLYVPHFQVSKEIRERVEQSAKSAPLQRLPDARLAVVRADRVFASLSLRL